MTLSVLHKYILAFLGLTLVVLIASLGTSRWAFERGFLDYVNDLEQTRLERAEAALAAEYRRAGDSWRGLTPHRLRGLLADAAPLDAGNTPGPGMGPPRGHRGRPSAQPPPGMQPRYPPTALYDASGARVAGPPLEAAGTINRTAIVVDGSTVGELRSSSRHRLTSPEEEAFLEQQVRARWLIGLAAMALALGMSIVLARGMLSPVRRMRDEVSRLSNGDYSARLASKRSDELGDLMRNLDRLAVTLDESRASRQRWFADVSHELRTPVAVLAGQLEAMQDGVRPVDAGQLESLAEEVGRLSSLVDDLYELSLSDIGGLRYEFSSVMLDESLQKALAVIQPRAREQGITISSALAPLAVNADPGRLGQLWLNLLGNAIAYTDAPGELRISVDREQGNALILIEDSPPGVPAADCEQLFEALYRRESSRSRHTGGAGLGLALCRKVVEAHSGSVAAEPSALGGLCVSVRLPLREDRGE